MLRSIKQLYGNKLVALDGEIGRVKDFYFDDQNWAIRYLVADTGSWLPGRQVLLSPYSLGRLEPNGKVWRANLTREQIEEGPAIELHKPVSRQYEEEYHRYYGWPFYWQGGGQDSGLLGMNGFFISAQTAKTSTGQPCKAMGSKLKYAGAHLLSTRAVSGHRHQANNGMTGHVCDFMIDAQSWAIRQLVVKPGQQFSCEEIGIPMGKVERLSWDKSTMCIILTEEEVELGPAHRLDPVGAAD